LTLKIQAAKAMTVATNATTRLSAVARVANLVKNYQMDEVVVPALAGVTLDFEEGDFIALMGPSGSGKSTLLNLLGCLDRCTHGQYFLGAEDVAYIDDNQLSEVRSRYLGFIFQSYNLLPQYTVVENIEIPLLYQGCRLTAATRARCIVLAELVGLGNRLDHRPSQLSGGQQQRVAIARALVNDPHVILADEPTGNLDSHTSDEIMHLLRELNHAGKTIIMVTHEHEIAAWARRVVRMRDGRIESDVRNDTGPSVSIEMLRCHDFALSNGAITAPGPSPRASAAWHSNVSAVWMKALSSLVLALRSLWLHKLRSVLSVLGIIIGTASVIALLAFGRGSMEDALEDIRRQGTTNVIVSSVKPVDAPASARPTWVVNYGLTWEDFERFKLIDTVIGEVPMRIFPQEVRHIGRKATARVVATTETYAKVNHFEMAAGRFLRDGEDEADEGDAQRLRNVAVLGCAVAAELFPYEAAVGQSIVINKAEYIVVGVIKDRLPRALTAGKPSGENYNMDVYMPIRTCRVRFGQKVMFRQGSNVIAEQVELYQITLTISDIDQVRSTGNVVSEMLKRSHNRKDWEVVVPLDRLKQAEDARDRYNMLLMLIASISLLVGGIGIMNIMLATVTERTREIGIRRALGAKRWDITMQFIIEAVVQTSIGGLLGAVTGLAMVFGIPVVAGMLTQKPLPAQIDIASIFLSLAVAVSVGILFGWYPARRASRLEPIEALRHT
jgi:ABC-type lipoprotein export system ATPase subunit/ABC-type antimicrobial peptide transport system permease subunit